MRRKILAVTASCLLFTATLLAGCGEDGTAASQQTTQTTGETAAVESTQPQESTATESTPGPTTEPTQSQETEPTAPQAGMATEPTVPQGTNETEPTQPQESSTAQPTAPVEETCEVETIYGSLYFSTEWAEYMQVQQTQHDGVLKVSFLARVNEKDYPLFELLIQKDSKEAPFVLTDSEGNPHGVDVQVEQHLEHEELDENSQRILYAMQEEVNYILEHIN